MMKTHNPASTVKIVWVLLLAFALRMGFSLVIFPILVKNRGVELGWVKDGKLQVDPYESIARNIVAGKEYVDDTGRFNYERLPLYTYFLASIYATMGDRPWALQIIQSLLDTASCLLIFLVGLRLHGREGPALWAAILYAVYFKMIALVPRPFSEPLYIFLLLLFFYLYLRDQDRPITGWFLGILLGLLTIIKPITLLFPPVFALIRRHDKNKILSVNFLLFIIGFGLIVTPVFLRNHLLTGKTFFSTGGGKMLYMGTVIDYSGRFRQNEQNLMDEIKEKYPFQYDINVDNHLRRMALKNVKKGPFAYLNRILHRTYYFWAYPDFSTRMMGIKTIAIFLFNLSLVILALVGFYLAWKKGLKVGIFIGIFFYFYGLHTIIYAYSRYSLPLFPILFIFAAFTANHWLDRRKNRTPEKS